MERLAAEFLKQWLEADSRKPMVIRGARQVGKTWLVRHLAETENLNLIEINFEKRPELASLFASNEPKEIVENIEAKFNITLDPSTSLLFLDEIQVAPELLSKLRWFYEELPELPVIAAGSLLEFVLKEHSMSMPVGRINYLHLEPLSFEEFLRANSKIKLCEYLNNFTWDKTIPEAIHTELTNLFKEYLLIGGLPFIVKTWRDNRSLDKVHQAQHDLLATYRDDFAKYAGRIDIGVLEEVLQAIPRLLGNKFVYSHVSKEANLPSIKKALKLLCRARIAHLTQWSAANGVPLGSEIKEKSFKAILLDTGLASSMLGLGLNQLKSADDITLVNQGGISEQVVGQVLRTLEPFYSEPKNYYWAREEKTSSAEIDYVIQHQNQVVPIEVKSGSTGSLKSLHLFMKLKNLDKAVRINSDLPSITAVNTKVHTGETVEYTLYTLPFYLAGQLHRLLSV